MTMSANRHSYSSLILCCLSVFLSNPSIGNPFWTEQSIEGDTLFFIQDNGKQRPVSSLLLVPRGTPVLRSATGEIRYEQGIDFIWNPGSRKLELPEGSRIPFKTRAEISSDAPANHGAGDMQGKSLFFSEGHVFHDLQVVATYQAQERWTGYVPPEKHHYLPNTIARLKSGASINLVVLGDSISAGFNASGVTGAKPGLPGYPSLVARDLEQVSSSDISLINLSVGGTRSEWGATKVADVIKAAPDILIVAFGMNDAVVQALPTVTEAQFAKNIRTIIDETRKALPSCEFILVAGMIGNDQWLLLDQNKFREFKDELLRIEGPGIAVADVTSLWVDLLKRKSFYDLTGNGLNHPNDFGHRIYADVILQLMIR